MRISDLGAKTIFSVIGALAIVVAITYFSEWILFLPSLIGFFILVKFGKEVVAKFIALLIFKPASSFFLIFMASKLHVFEHFPYRYPEIVSAFLWLVLELPLTLIIISVYRYLFTSYRVSWIFFLGDIVRWVSLCIVSLIPEPFPEPYFYTQLYVFVFFAIFYPSLYAIGGLVTVIKRANRNKPAEQLADAESA